MKRKYLWTAAAALAGAAAPFVIEAAHRQIDRLRYTPPGEMVSVHGREMHVYSEGEGPKTIVFLPGLGTPCPAIDFMPLVTRLRRQFRCVIPEPLGYGYSDAAPRSRARTSEHIVDELRAGLRAAGFRPPYVLLGHSIAGIYMLNWAARYPSEVEAVIGDDTTLPGQFEDPVLRAGESAPPWYFPLLNRSGLIRLYDRLPLQASKRLNALSGGDRSRLPEVRALSARNTLCRTVEDEARHVLSNCRAAQRLHFPKTCRLLHFVAQGTVDQLSESSFDWLAEHQKQALSVSDGHCLLLTGEHYLHWTQADSMAKAIRAFLAPPQPAPAKPVSPIRRFVPGKKD